LKSGGSWVVAIDDLAHEFHCLQALLGYWRQPVSFLIRLIMQVGDGESGLSTRMENSGDFKGKLYHKDGVGIG